MSRQVQVMLFGIVEQRVSKQFASVADLDEKKTTFVPLADHCWGHAADGDPNTGAIVGADGVLIVDTLARLRRFGAEKLLPGRGPALTSPADVGRGFNYITDFVSTLFACARQAVAAGMNLKQAMAHTCRAMDEASGICHPRIWAAARDQEMWRGLQAAD